MTAKMRCVMCGSRFDAGSASQRVADYNRHDCGLSQPATLVHTTRVVFALLALVLGLMVSNWLVDTLAGSGWFTPVAIVGTLAAGVVLAFKPNAGD
jgi:predicted methyltransferase